MKTLPEYVKDKTQGKIKLSDVITESGIARSTLNDWYADKDGNPSSKVTRIDLLVDGVLKRRMDKYFN